MDYTNKDDLRHTQNNILPFSIFSQFPNTSYKQSTKAMQR